MGIKLSWIGLTMILAAPKFAQLKYMDMTGALFMVVGAVLITLGK